jgi:biotin operon repressor
MNKLDPYRPCGEIPANSTAKLLYLVLRDLANDRDEIIIPQRRLAEALGISRRAISANLHRLEQAGVLDIQALHNAYGSRLPNKYKLKGSKKDGTT